MDSLSLRYSLYHETRMFFENRAAWLRFYSNIGPVMDSQWYEAIVYGTDAEVYVPLWASACLSGMDILLNEITLEVIRFYKQHGYQPVSMDGNPPDYIGEQLRFCEYLCRCALNGNSTAETALENFIDRFLLDTFHGMQTALSGFEIPELKTLCSLCTAAMTGETVDCCDFLCPEEYDSVSWTEHAPIPLSPPKQVGHVSFNDCGNKCKFFSFVQEGCVLSMKPDSGCEKRFSGCPRGAAYRATFLSSHRLRYPMSRVGTRGEGKFHRISLDEAAEDIFKALQESRSYGPGSRYVMDGAGVRAFLRGTDMMRRLLSLDGGYLSFYNTYSVGGALPVVLKTLNRFNIGSHPAELLNAKLIILWGSNALVTHFGSQQKEYLMRAKEQGIRIISIDPRKSDTAIALNAEWLPIHPGTDAALVDAMCYVMRSREFYDRSFINQFCLGFDAGNMPDGVPVEAGYFAYLEGRQDGIPKTPEWASCITGLSAAAIEQLAVDYATAKYACIVPGLGPQRTLCGEQTYRGMLVLPCLAGSMGKPGGGLVTWSKKEQFVYDESGFLPNPYPVQIPTFYWTKAISSPQELTPENGLLNADRLDTGVRYLYSIASGIMMNQHSDINNTKRILGDTDMVRQIVVADLFMTPGAKYADLLLPAPSFFETENICDAWAPENYILYNRAAIAPLFGSVPELNWVSRVARLMGVEESFSAGKATTEDWLREMWNGFYKLNSGVPDFDALREACIALLPEQEGTIAFAEELRGNKPFDTPSGKIELFWQEYYHSPRKDIPSIPRYVPVEEGYEEAQSSVYPLQLIGYHSRRLCHSTHNQNVLLDELETARIWLSPSDASKRGIENGTVVEVFNARGAVRLPAFVTDRIMAGVAAMPEGFWYKAEANDIDTGGAVNTLTMSHRGAPVFGGNPQHTNLVEVRPAHENKEASL